MSNPTVGYVLSDTFPYGKTFYEDSGPPFAADYQWTTCNLSSMEDTAADVFVVDDRIPSSELPRLKNIVETSRRPFLLKLCDPGMDHCTGHWWYQFATMLLDHPNVHYLINYHPVEWTARFFVRARRSKFIWAPYLYIPENERPIHHAARAGNFIVSGRLNSQLYPLRTQMNGMSKIPPLSFVTKRLPHPGYRDRTHDVVGSSYVDMLSNYRFGAVCSSRCRVELLKYREFAYAGLVPVGDLPFTLWDCPAEAWIPWKRNVFAMTAAMRGPDESQRMAESYRAFIRRARDAAPMRDLVNDALSRL